MAGNTVAPFETFDEFGQSNYTPIQRADAATGELTIYGYKDQNGNIWDSPPKVVDDFLNYSTPNLVLSSEVTNDPYVSALGVVNTDIQAAKDLQSLKESNPSEFYKQVSSQLEDKIYNDWKFNNTNSNTGVARELLEGIKEIDPQSYYTAKLTDLGRSLGWQIGQNRSDRNAPTIAQIEALIPEAQAAGLSAEQINSIIGNSSNYANIENQRAIANNAASGNFWKENIAGAAKVGALALGAYGLDQALTAGAAAGAELAGPTYGELGITGVEGGFAGPTYAEMGYTGLNQGQAIAAADAASKGLTMSEALKYANQARQGLGLASSIAKLAGGSGAGGQSGANSGLDLNKLASLLSGGQTPQTNSYIGQIKGNENPFLFTTPGQTQATEGTYDVSGSSLANALRKR